MRILGVVLIILGLLFCLSIVGAIIGVPLIILGIILAALGGRRKVVINNTVSVSNAAPLTKAESNRPPLSSSPVYSYDRRKWEALAKYDQDISAAVEKVRPLGSKWEDELAETYFQLQNKAYLGSIVAKILEEAQKN